MTTYFIAQDVCDKLNIRNSSQVFKTHALIEGRDYIKFRPSMNSTAFKSLLDTGLIDIHSTSCNLFTIIGLIEVLFKSKNPEARQIKDKLVGAEGYEIYGSVAYSLVNKIVGNLSPDKRTQFYKDETYAFELIRKKAEAWNDDVRRAVEIVRLFGNGQPSVVTEESNHIDITVLLNEFKNFSM